jgi:hypothetical protein
VAASGNAEVVLSGSSFATCSGNDGGAVLVSQGSLRVVNCTFADCSAIGTSTGGMGGAVLADDVPAAVVLGTGFTGCRARERGGALRIQATQMSSPVQVHACEFFDCRVTGALPSAGLGGGLDVSDGAVAISSSSVLSCGASVRGGGIHVATDGRVRMVNCTIAENDADRVGGLHLACGDAYISHITCTSNRSVQPPAGIWHQGTVWFKNTILAHSLVSGGDESQGWAVNAQALDGYGNVQWPATRGASLETVTLSYTTLVADPKLTAFGANGGPTRTYLLDILSTVHSAAYRAGTEGGAPDRDQRGFTRMPLIDAGAVQMNGVGGNG